VDFFQNLKNIDYLWLTAAGLACAQVLAISHWGPWTWKIGRQMPRYWAYWTGILAVLWGWGLWSYFYGSLLNWLVLLICNLLLHWPLWLWANEWMHRWSRAVSYGFASLPILAVYTAWCIAQGDYLSPALLFVVYGIGGLCTLGYYRFDGWIKSTWDE
jgi:hypothetical protein